MIHAMHYLQHGTIGTRGFSGQIIERVRKDAISRKSTLTDRTKNRPDFI